MKQKSLEHLFKMRRKTYHKAEEESSGEKWRRNHFFFLQEQIIYFASHFKAGRTHSLSSLSGRRTAKEEQDLLTKDQCSLFRSLETRNVLLSFGEVSGRQERFAKFVKFVTFRTCLVR